MLIDNRLQTRDCLPEDESLPCTGGGNRTATLEVFGRPLLRGNRSRIVLIAGELDARLDSVSGRLEACVLQVGVPADEASRVWVPNAGGKLLMITSFGAEVLSVHRREEKWTTMPPASFAPGEEILLSLRAYLGGMADIVLILEYPR